jgi:hypothetical protein
MIMLMEDDLDRIEKELQNAAWYRNNKEAERLLERIQLARRGYPKKEEAND